MILFSLTFLMLCGFLSYISVADQWTGTSCTIPEGGAGHGWARSPGNQEREHCQPWG